MKSRKKLTKGMLRRKNTRFFIIYVLVVAAMAVCLLLGKGILEDVLTEYEADLPIHAAEKYFTLFENGDYETLYDYETDYRDAAREDYAQAVSRMVSGEMALVKQAGDGMYAVTLDGKRFATIQMARRDGVWALESVHVLNVASHSYQVKARDDYHVYCDGVELTEADRISTGEALEVAKYLPEDCAAPTLCVYEISRIAGGTPEFTCVDDKGRDVPLTDDGTGLLVAGENFEEPDEELEKWIVMTAKCCSLYTSDDVDFIEMAKYLEKDSAAYNALRSMERGWFTLHTAYRFENVSVSNVRYFGDDVMCCDVGLDFIYTIKQTGNDKTNTMRYTLYYRNVDGKWLMYSMVTRSAEEG